MLPSLTQYLQDQVAGTTAEPYLSWLRLFGYLTFRSTGALITALVLSWWLGPKVIRWLKELSFGEQWSRTGEFAGDPRQRKKGTPTAGGLLITLALVTTTLLWAQLDNRYVLLALLSVVVLCGLGFYDDYAKIAAGNARGASSTIKLVVQIVLALGIGLYLWRDERTARLITEIMVPFYKHPIAVGVPALGLLLALVTIVGSSNAVNLTDGLDGLAIGCTLMVSVVFLVTSYLAGNIKAATYLQIPYVPGAGELAIFCAAMVGAGLGFLWFNCHPAQMFMGDTGSLALGGALGIVAVLIHQPFLLFLAGGVFVVEAVSVMLQRGWFKWTRVRTGTGQRLFLMAPIHHHFERRGWAETQVVTRFYILGVLCAVIALGSLKVR
jgi:phospho-N-acetylmuramoyl-pentapeptide-transferase